MNKTPEPLDRIHTRPPPPRGKGKEALVALPAHADLILCVSVFAFGPACVYESD